MNQKISTPKQFVEVIKSFHDTDGFYDLAAQSFGSKFLYAILIAILCCLLQYGTSAIIFANDDTLADTINSIPEFSYTNGQLTLQDKFVFDSDGIYLNADTSIECMYLQAYNSTPEPYAVSMDSLLQELISSKKYEGIMLASKSNIIMVDISSGKIEYQEMKYSQLGSLFHIYSITKDNIVSGYKGFIYKLLGIIGLIMFPLKVIEIFFISLLLSLVGLIVNSTTKNKENFGTIYWMTFYMYCCLTLLATILGLVLHRKFKIVLLILYIYLIKRTLDNGEASVPTEYSSASYGNNSYGVVRDDFDAFMNTDSYYGNTINSSNNSTDSSSSFNLRGYEPTNRDDQ